MSILTDIYKKKSCYTLTVLWLNRQYNIRTTLYVLEVGVSIKGIQEHQNSFKHHLVLLLEDSKEEMCNGIDQVVVFSY